MKKIEVCFVDPSFYQVFHVNVKLGYVYTWLFKKLNRFIRMQLRFIPKRRY
jgi:hypothetical protein